MKIIQITDVHLRGPGKGVFDHDPIARLNACLRDIEKNHADADLCVITGDLAHHGEIDAYRAFKSELEGFRLPVQLLVGNHDDRQTFTSVFPDVKTDGNGFIQSSMQTPVGKFLFLDTAEVGTHAGWYCEKRQEWLRGELAGDGLPNYIFMHHPPFAVHFRPNDELMLQNGDAFKKVIAGHNIRHMFMGHVHRPISGSWNAIPFNTLRGLNHQIWLDFSAPTGIPCSMEPPAYAVIFITEESVVIHNHDFLDASQKYLYDPDAPHDEQVKAI
jgi:3',5'-cyclic-AMP phosphodiesterase